MSNSTPSDQLVALRSFVRRYTELGESMAKAEDLPERAAAPDAAGNTAVDHLVSVAAGLDRVGLAIQRALSSNGPAVESDAFAQPPVTRAPAGTDFAGGVSAVTGSAGALADRVEAINTSSWSEEVQVADGSTRSLTDLVEVGVDIGAEGLGHVKAALKS